MILKTKNTPTTIDRKQEGDDHLSHPLVCKYIMILLFGILYTTYRKAGLDACI